MWSSKPPEPPLDLPLSTEVTEDTDQNEDFKSSWIRRTGVDYSILCIVIISCAGPYGLIPITLSWLMDIPFSLIVMVSDLKF